MMNEHFQSGAVLSRERRTATLTEKLTHPMEKKTVDGNAVLFVLVFDVLRSIMPKVARHGVVVV